MTTMLMRYLLLAVLVGITGSAWAQQLQSEVSHDTALPVASKMLVTGCEAKDQDGAALPRAVSTEGDAVRCASSLFGVPYFMPVNEDGSAVATINIGTVRAPTAGTADTEFTTQTADFDVEAATTNLRLLGFNIAEDAATAAVATVVVRHGVLAAGNCTATGTYGRYELGPNQSIYVSFGDRGRVASSGVCVDVLAGSVYFVAGFVTEAAP